MMLKTKCRQVLNSVAAALITIMFFIPAQEANAIEFDPKVASLCFGIGVSGASTSAIFDVDGTGPLEIFIVSRNDLVKLDDDMDQLAEGTLIRKYRLLDSDGNDLWSSPATMVLGASDALASFVNDVVPFASKDLGGDSRLLDFFPVPFLCEGAIVAEAGGTKYLVVTLGVSAAEGDETTGPDRSVMKVLLLNIGTGAVEVSHKFSPQGANNLLLFESRIGDYDGDGDDEIIMVRSVYLGPSGNRERFKLIIEVFNMLTKAMEKRVVIFTNDEFLNENPVF